MAILLLDRAFQKSELGAHQDIELRNVGPKVWPDVLLHCRPESLTLYHITLANLKGIEQLETVNSLRMEWATKIVDISPVFELKGLRSLTVYGFSKLRSLEGIDKLKNITELNLSGDRASLTSKLRLATVRPVSELSGLSSLSLTNARLDDDDTTFLARCKNLRHLHLSSQFDLKQVAYLAKHLNSGLREPITACTETTLVCTKCGHGKMMFSWRKAPFLCPSCDATRFNRLVSEFQNSVCNA